MEKKKTKKKTGDSYKASYITQYYLTIKNERNGGGDGGLWGGWEGAGAGGGAGGEHTEYIYNYMHAKCVQAWKRLVTLNVGCKPTSCGGQKTRNTSYLKQTDKIVSVSQLHAGGKKTENILP